MADCSKTEDFIHERERMCKFYENCEGCPATDLVVEDTCLCSAYEDDFIKDTIIVVQKWSDSHPAPKPKTYADDFFEKFPNAPKDENGLPKAYLCDVYASKSFECFGCAAEDGRKCWLEPYPEQEKSK